MAFISAKNSRKRSEPASLKSCLISSSFHFPSGPEMLFSNSSKICSGLRDVYSSCWLLSSALGLHPAKASQESLRTQRKTRSTMAQERLPSICKMTWQSPNRQAFARVMLIFWTFQFFADYIFAFKNLGYAGFELFFQLFTWAGAMSFSLAICWIVFWFSRASLVTRTLNSTVGCLLFRLLILVLFGVFCSSETSSIC